MTEYPLAIEKLATPGLAQSHTDFLPQILKRRLLSQLPFFKQSQSLSNDLAR